MDGARNARHSLRLTSDLSRPLDLTMSDVDAMRPSFKSAYHALDVAMRFKRSGSGVPIGLPPIISFVSTPRLLRESGYSRTVVLLDKFSGHRHINLVF